jgi:hypothetical protein
VEGGLKHENWLEGAPPWQQTPGVNYVLDWGGRQGLSRLLSCQTRPPPTSWYVGLICSAAPVPPRRRAGAGVGTLNCLSPRFRCS